MSNPLRIGIVGAGFIADIMARAIEDAEGAVLVAIASRRREAAEMLASRYTGVRTFETWEELVAWDGLDAVYVATPTSVREPISVAAAQHHKHVLADKPFASLSSLQAITKACRTYGVAFLDATHFVHHPRTLQLKQEVAQRIGPAQSIASAFFFPSMDRHNIRHDPTKEPMGAIGDMAWYTTRAVVEFTPPDAQFVSASGFGVRDATTGAMVRGTGVVLLSNGCTATWDVGYNTGACLMDVDIRGPEGTISIDDFVLDWAQSFFLADPASPTGFTQRNGPVNRSGFVHVATPSPKRQNVLLIEHFVALAKDASGPAIDASIQVSERTQGLLDAVWATLVVA